MFPNRSLSSHSYFVLQHTSETFAPRNFRPYMKSEKLLVLLLVACAAAAQSQDLVILGDSLSDGGLSGNGLSAYIKLALQTNDVSIENKSVLEATSSSGLMWIDKILWGGRACFSNAKFLVTYL